MNLRIAIVAAILSCVVATTPAWTSGTSAGSGQVFQALSSVPTLEVCAQAASLVKQAPMDRREAIALEVVNYVEALDRKLIPFVVSAIGRVAPEVSAATAAQAVRLEPLQTPPILRAAISAAPGQLAAIVSRICRENPARYEEVATVAAASISGQDETIAAAIATATPMLAKLLERGRHESTLAGSPASLQSTVSYAKRLEQMAAKQQAARSKKPQAEITPVNRDQAVAGAPATPRSIDRPSLAQPSVASPTFVIPSLSQWEETALLASTISVKPNASLSPVSAGEQLAMPPSVGDPFVFPNRPLGGNEIDHDCTELLVGSRNYSAP